MDFSRITQIYKYRTELHAHSFPVSSCGRFSPAEVMEIYSNEGCNTVTITNHLKSKQLLKMPADELSEYYLSAYYQAREAAQKYGMNVALGVEIQFAESQNEYLVYGVCPEDMKRIVELLGTDIATFYREFKNDKNVILHAHPFRPNLDPTPVDSVDGIETFNTHPGHNSQIGVATKFAKQHGFIVSGGSDFHEEGRQATCLMRTKAPITDSYDVAAALKSRDVIFDMNGHIVIPYL